MSLYVPRKMSFEYFEEADSELIDVQFVSPCKDNLLLSHNLLERLTWNINGFRCFADLERILFWLHENLNHDFGYLSAHTENFG